MDFTAAAGPRGKPPATQRFPELARHNGRHVNILLVEDHAESASALALLLRQDGYNVYVASTIQDALHLVDQKKVDLVITDVGLPDGEGCDLMSELHSRFQLKGIALSNDGSPVDPIHLHASGFVESLPKPIEFADLFAAIRLASPPPPMDGRE